MSSWPRDSPGVKLPTAGLRPPRGIFSTGPDTGPGLFCLSPFPQCRNEAGTGMTAPNISLHPAPLRDPTTAPLRRARLGTARLSANAGPWGLRGDRGLSSGWAEFPNQGDRDRGLLGPGHNTAVHPNTPRPSPTRWLALGLSDALSTSAASLPRERGRPLAGLLALPFGW